MKKKASICQFLKINFISCIYKLKQIHISIRGLLINYIRGRLPGRSKKYKDIQLPYLYCVELKKKEQMFLQNKYHTLKYHFREDALLSVCRRASSVNNLHF